MKRINLAPHGQGVRGLNLSRLSACGFLLFRHRFHGEPQPAFFISLEHFDTHGLAFL